MTGRVVTQRPTEYSSYGFIRSDDGVEYFFHSSELVDGFDVRVGDTVSFEPVVPAPAKGPRAVSVAFVAPGGPA